VTFYFDWNNNKKKESIHARKFMCSVCLCVGF